MTSQVINKLLLIGGKLGDTSVLCLFNLNTTIFQHYETQCDRRMEWFR